MVPSVIFYSQETLKNSKSETLSLQADVYGWDIQFDMEVFKNVAGITEERVAQVILHFDKYFSRTLADHRRTQCSRC